ncbi:hypothetical protein CB0940_12245 [Cercospora beticola]|uniref:Uncharacterized protein n=1 Tax=Cercospora beticola TaxID=122368 RepID=A0A2G5H5P7_CERBT|nr:hypothetical protein CB0940_12245 [Cercospora beticola]PIA87871.1 hypothetical protein CB0940_12245 [Cercospora beticola]WPB04517.1 hypothetical protein RHO25_009163 [Cercospora beticola]CAK1364260.1 unnamed protein product [Cercospora beticola]
MAPAVAYDSHPIMRLVIRICRENFTSFSGHDRLAVFNDIFQPQLLTMGFANGRIPYFDSLDSQWRDRIRTQRNIDRWETILKDPGEMTAEELWAYIWLYDLVRLTADRLGLGDPSTELVKWEGVDFIPQFNIDNEVWDEMMEIRRSSEQTVIHSRSSTGPFIGFRVELPGEWAGVDGYFNVAKPDVPEMESEDEDDESDDEEDSEEDEDSGDDE